MKFITKICACALFPILASCSYVDQRMMMSMQEQELSELSAECSRLNQSVKTLSNLLNNIRSGDVVTSYSPITKSGKIVGYTLNFEKHGTINLYYGEKGEDGQSGAQGDKGDDISATSLSIIPKKDADGQWYWYYNGKFVTNSNNEKIPSKIENTGYVPQFKIVDGFWYLSDDNGQTWERMDVPGSVSALENSVFNYVVKGKDCVYIYISDGSCICAKSETAEDIEARQKAQYDSLSVIAAGDETLSQYIGTTDGCILTFGSKVFSLTIGEEYLFLAVEADRNFLTVICRDTVSLSFLRKEAYYLESVIVLPDNADGSVNTMSGTDKVLKFSARPTSTAALYPKTDAFKVMAVSTLVKGAEEQFELPVKTVDVTADIISLTVGTSNLPSSFFEGTTGVSARLQITSPDGSVFLSSYFSLKPVI